MFNATEAFKRGLKKTLSPSSKLKWLYIQMANLNPKQENLKPGENVVHGFYADGFLPCNKCLELDKCPNRNKFIDHRGKARCLEEKEFYENKVKEITESFQLDSKDIFQLPQMIMVMIRLKRMNRWIAEHGLTGKTLLFNPKTGDEHKFNTPGVLNRDVYYAQKGLISWLDSLKLSRSSRDAKDGVDVLAKMMMMASGKDGESKAHS